MILGDHEMSLCLGDGDVDSDVDGEAGEAACTGTVGRANGTGRNLALGRGVLPCRMGGMASENLSTGTATISNN